MEPQSTHTASAEASARSTANGHDPSAADALKQAGTHFAELREYASLYVSAKLDALKLTAKTAVLYAVLGIVGAVVGLGLLLTAASLLLIGLAGGIGAIFNPDRPWIGALIVGVVVLAGVFGSVFFLMKKLTGASRAQTIAKYESRKRDQRSQFGHDVQERAREQAQSEASRA